MGRLFGAFAVFLVLAQIATALAADPAPPPIEAYGRLPATELVALSPSGQRIAFITVSGNTRKLVLRMVGGPLISTSDVGESKVRSLHWAGEDYVILRISLKDHFGHGEWNEYESSRALVLNLKTREAYVVFNRALELVPEVVGYFGVRNLDGHWYGYFGADPLHAERSLYRVDLDSGDYRKLTTGLWAAIDADGSVAARAVYSILDHEWSLYAGLGNERKLLSVDDPFSDVGLLGLGRKPRTVLVSRPDRLDGTLWEYPVTGSDPPTSLSSNPDFGVIHGADGLALGVQFEDKQRRLHFFDPAVDRKVDLVAEAFKPHRIFVESWSTNFDRIIVESTGTDDPGTYYLVDVPAQKVDLIGKQYPGLGAGQIGSTRMLSYKAADGMQLEGVVTQPPGPESKNRPLVVLPHGGPEARDYLGFDWMAQAFASRGYVVFQPNFRGSSGYGTAFVRAGDGEWGRKMQTDISDGVAELARQGIVDPRRACIVGGSYGGYAALAGVTVQHGLYRCAVSVGGVTDLNDLLDWEAGHSSRNSVEVKYLKRQLGAKSLSDSALDAFSPVQQAAAADAPVLLIYGKDDTVVPIRESEAMAKALQHAGKPVQTLVLKEEDHWLSREATRIEMLKEAVGFVEKNNPVN